MAHIVQASCETDVRGQQILVEGLHLRHVEELQPQPGVSPPCDDEGTSVLPLGAGKTHGLDVVSQLHWSGQADQGHVELGDSQLQQDVGWRLVWTGC